MSVSGLLEVLYCTLVVLPLVIAKKKDLEIITLYNPDDCAIKADDGDEVFVHYTGSLESGQVFDSSVQAQREPLSFILGQGRVIQGWEKGLIGMCVGEKRKLVIPSHMGYGDKGYPPAIPPKATLIFETELMDLRKGSSPTEKGLAMLLKLLTVPVAIGVVAYYVYNKYQRDVAEEKKTDRKSRKKRQ